MTELRLASINGEQTIGIDLTATMAEEAQAFADVIGLGNYRQALIVTVDNGGLVDFSCIGEPVTSDRGIGLLELAKARIVAGCFR